MLSQMWSLLVSQREFYLDLLLQHIAISFIAIIIAVILGGTIGVLISEHDTASKPTLGAISFLYTIPAISMLGFLIPFSGIGNVTAVIALTLYALMPMVRNTYTGIKNVDPAIIEAATGMGSTKNEVMYKIKIPLALPYIVMGIRSMVVMTIALAGIASFIGAGGLGVAIYRGITINNSAMTMNGSLLIAALALIVDFILGLVEKHIVARRPKVKKNSSKKRNVIIRVAVIAIIAVSVVIAFAVGNTSDDTIKMATKPMTEQYIIGNMVKTMVEQDTDLTVEITEGVGGGTANIEPGMESGEFDMYPEYTGTGWNNVLKNSGFYDESLFFDLQKQYEEKLGMQWTSMFGFNNTYGIAVRKDIADKYNLKTYSDLQAVDQDLTFGGEYDFFAREDGYDSLCKEYGLDFNKTRDLDIGLKYQAMEEGSIDVMNIFTTDGKLSQADVVVLEDNKNFYPSYECGMVIRSETLKKYPELQMVFDKLEGSINDEDMAEMNYLVEEKDKNPADVANDFLKEKNLIN